MTIEIYNSEARELTKKLFSYTHMNKDSYNVLNATSKVLNVSFYKYDRKWLAIYLNIAPLNYHYARLQFNIK